MHALVNRCGVPDMSGVVPREIRVCVEGNSLLEFIKISTGRHIFLTDCTVTIPYIVN
jgi:hypothetical protein